VVSLTARLSPPPQTRHLRGGLHGFFFSSLIHLFANSSDSWADCDRFYPPVALAQSFCGPVTVTNFNGPNGSNSTAQGTVTVTPGINVTSIRLNPSTVTGGNRSTGTVTIASPAPSGGNEVELSTSNVSTPPLLSVSGDLLQHGDGCGRKHQREFHREYYPFQYRFAPVQATPSPAVRPCLPTPP
jgi:hypothetical protein